MLATGTPTQCGDLRNFFDAIFRVQTKIDVDIRPPYLLDQISSVAQHQC